MGAGARGSMGGRPNPLRASVAPISSGRTLFRHKSARLCLAVKPLVTQRLPLAAALALTIAALAFAIGGLWPDAGEEARIAVSPPDVAGSFSGVAAPRLPQ